MNHQTLDLSLLLWRARLACCCSCSRTHRPALAIRQIRVEQVDFALDSLFQALAAGGHWWRFGWDREESEFQRFRGAAIEATAKFGSAALPMLWRAVRSHSPFEREAACWIVVSMVKDGSIDHAHLFEAGVLDGVRDLAKNDSDPAVRESCMSAVTRIESDDNIDRLPNGTETPNPK